MHELQEKRERVALLETYLEADDEHDARERALLEKERDLAVREVELLRRELDIERRESALKDDKIEFLEQSVEALKDRGFCFKRLIPPFIWGC